MHHKEFLSKIDHDKVVAAIAEAEKDTSGEIRVWISRREVSVALDAAQKRFSKLGMHKSAERNAVLVYIAPRSRVFAVVGDKAVHEKCGDEFWEEVTAQLSGDLKKGDVTEALIHAIRKTGALLAAHFPRKPGDKNQLPDDILHD